MTRGALLPSRIGSRMIPEKPAPDLIRGVQRLSEKIMRRQEPRTG